MGFGQDVDCGDEPRAAALPDPEILARLVPYLSESIMVVRRDWSVAADLAPPLGLLGHGPATGMHPFSNMHPDDVERVFGFATAAMRSDPGWTGALELRAQRADASYALFHITLHNRFDDPVLRGMVVVSRELPEPHAVRPRPGPVEASGVVDGASVDSAERAPVAVDLRIGTVGDHLPIGLLMLDERGDVVFANRAACELLDTDTRTLQSGKVPDGLDPVDRRELGAILQRLRTAPGKETFTATFRGDPERLLSATFVSRAGEGTGGAVQFVIVTVEDVTHRLAREQHLEHRANHDSLTGLPNRAWLLDRLDELLTAGVPLVVAFVDLDGFKTVNDRRGHAAGDDLLAGIASSLRSALAPGEAVARVGGDEFVVVADHDVDRDELRDRLRRAVRSTAGAAAHGVGVSVGVTEARAGDQPWDLLGRADAAMYGDKRRRH